MNQRSTFSNEQGVYEPLTQKQKLPPFILKKRAILIAGPTASGKSSLAIKISKILGGEVISADSMQAYRGMDIGTAKVFEEEKEGIPHHLIDIRNLNEKFNVFDYYQLAIEKIKDIQQRGKVPVVVGGTGFYHHALIYGPPQGPPSAPEIRASLEERADKLGVETLYGHLKEKDPGYAEQISPRDRQKIIRGLEIIEITGKKVSDFPTFSTPENPQELDFRCWFLYYPREILYSRIEMRCDEMIAKGFCQEVEALENIGFRENPTASRAIGYRQYLDYLNTPQSEKDWEQFVWEFKQASRRYAKRQFTWFRKEPLFRWVDLEIYPSEEVIDFIIEDYEKGF